MMTASEPGKKTVVIDFLYLDLEVCERCRGTDANLETALATVGTVLESAGADVRVTRTLVDSEQKARTLGFASSPTIRVNGRDIALEFRESRCESEACACADASGSAIDCRVWIYQGKEHTAAPVPMIVDAILSGVYGVAPATAAPAIDVPENLLRLYRSRERKDEAACCDARRQASCCEPSQKASCCGPRREADAGACGCQ
jgi:hypothetical protein